MSGDDLLGRITIDPDLCNGRPTLRGKRIAVQTILELLGAGESREEVLRQYPSLEPEDLDACIASMEEFLREDVERGLRGRD